MLIGKHKKLKAKKHPKLYDNVDDLLIKQFQNKNILFARKIYKKFNDLS